MSDETFNLAEGTADEWYSRRLLGVMLTSPIDPYLPEMFKLLETKYGGCGHDQACESDEACTCQEALEWMARECQVC